MQREFPDVMRARPRTLVNQPHAFGAERGQRRSGRTTDDPDATLNWRFSTAGRK
jgi:hypothetical protein